jgi:hypothetical protein
VHVTGEPGALSTTSAADGTFNLTKVPVGGYVLMLSLDGYLTQTVPVSVGLSTTTHVTVALATDTASSGGLAVTLADDLTAGYDATVTLTAQVTSPDADAASMTYGWTQTGGTPAAALAGQATPSLTFHTLRLSDAKPEASLDAGALVPARFGPMGIGIDETGNYQFQVTATDPEGHSVTTTALVWATPPTSGLRSVPFGVPVWFEGDTSTPSGAAMTSWSWTLTGPSHSSATLVGAATQFPSFTPDVPGDYEVTETVSGRSTSVHAGSWDGISGVASQPGSGTDYVVQGCTSSGCHIGPVHYPENPQADAAPNMFPAWAGTQHAVAFSDGIDGKFGPDFGPRCLQCHTLGYSPASPGNGGFDDQAQADSWALPATLAPGNYAAMVKQQPDLAQKANVQCESCHGPKSLDVMGVDDTSAISFSSGVCGTCHSQGQDWKQSAHANLTLAMGEGLAVPAHCGRCHTAQGFAQYAEQLDEWTGQYPSSAAGYLTSDGYQAAFDGGVETNAATPASLANLGLAAATVESQTCSACHDPHNRAGLTAQLRVYDSLPAGLPNGQGAITGVGSGAICMTCHNTRNGETDDLTAAAGALSGTAAIGRGPHDGPQTDVLFGVNAYFMGGAASPSPHLAVKDTCAGCHYAIPNAAEAFAGETTNHSFLADLSICTSCHGSGVDGQALQQGVKSQMAALDGAIFGSIAGTLAAESNGYVIGSAEDTSTGLFLCTTVVGTTPVVALTAGQTPPASSITEPQPVAKWRSLGTIWAVPQVASGAIPECTATGGATTTTYNGAAPVQIALGSVQPGTTYVAKGATSFVFPQNSVVAKAVSNEALLHDDESWGIHNLPFTQAVITNTIAALAP